MEESCTYQDETGTFPGFQNTFWFPLSATPHPTPPPATIPLPSFFPLFLTLKITNLRSSTSITISSQILNPASLQPVPTQIYRSKKEKARSTLKNSELIHLFSELDSLPEKEQAVLDKEITAYIRD